MTLPHQYLRNALNGLVSVWLREQLIDGGSIEQLTPLKYFASAIHPCLQLSLSIAEVGHWASGESFWEGWSHAWGTVQYRQIEFLFLPVFCFVPQLFTSPRKSSG